MYKLYLILICVSICFITSCSTDKRNSNFNSSNSEEISSKILTIPLVNSHNELKLSEVFESIDTISLYCTSKQYLKFVKKIIIDNNKIYILSAENMFGKNGKIFVFDSTGNNLEIIDHVGQGPLEYKFISDFNIFNDTVEILDRKKMIKYTNNDVFIDYFNHEFIADNFLKINNSEYYFYSKFRSYELGDSKLFKYFLNHNVENIYIPTHPVAFSYLLTNDTRNLIYFDKKNILFDSSIDTIYSIEDNSLIPLWIFEKYNKRLNDDLLNNKFKNIFEFMEFIKNREYIYPVNGYFENQKWLTVFFNYQGNINHLFYDKEMNRQYSTSKWINDLGGTAKIEEMFFKQIDKYYLYLYTQELDDKISKSNTVGYLLKFRFK